MKRTIELNKTYRLQAGAQYALLQVTKAENGALEVKDLKSGKVKNVSQASFQKKLDNGDIYVSATTAAAQPLYEKNSWESKAQAELLEDLKDVKNALLKVSDASKVRTFAHLEPTQELLKDAKSLSTRAGQLLVNLERSVGKFAAKAAATAALPKAKSVIVCPECGYENQTDWCLLSDNEEEMYCDECEHVLDPDDCVDISKYKWREKKH